MKYEFELLDKLIYGELAPANHAFDVDAALSYLKKIFSHYSSHYTLYFKSTLSHEYIINNIRKSAFLEIPLTSPQDLPAFHDDALVRKLIDLSLPRLSIGEEAITNAYYRQHKNDLILEIRAEADFDKLTPREAKYYFYHTYISDEVSRVKQVLNKSAFSLSTENQIEFYIQNHQLALGALMTFLLESLEDKEKKSLYSQTTEYSTSDIYKMMYVGLEKIVTHIEKYFTKYVDVSIAAPYRTRLLSSVEIEKNLEVVYTKLLEGDIDQRLFKILEISLIKLSHISEEIHFTYKDLLYHKKMLSELYHACEGNSTITEQAIIQVLYRVNFNSISFFDYLTTDIEKVLVETESNARIEKLYLYRKVYSQNSIRTNMAYHGSLPSIRQQVLNWIDEEIIYQEKVADKEADRDKGSGNTEIEKLTTGLSVAQLSYLFKILAETEVISAKSGNQLFRFLQNNFSSKRQEKISVHSLSNKYYNTEQATKKAVKEVVIGLLNYINKSK